MKTIENKIGLIPGAKDMLQRYLKIGLGLLMLGTAQAQAAEAITFYHNDLLGSPVAVTDINGDLCWREDYKPYGEKLYNDDSYQSSNPLCGFDDNHRGYTNHVNDKDIGLTYMQARYYDPAIGRFMGIDPIGVVLNESSTFNRYAYAANNPYKYIDPDGRAIGDPNADNSDQDNGGSLADAPGHQFGKPPANPGVAADFFKGFLSYFSDIPEGFKFHAELSGLYGEEEQKRAQVEQEALERAYEALKDPEVQRRARDYAIQYAQEHPHVVAGRLTATIGVPAVTLAAPVPAPVKAIAPIIGATSLYGGVRRGVGDAVSVGQDAVEGLVEGILGAGTQ